MAKPKTSKKLDFWRTKQGLAVQAGIALIFSYVVASLAINSGSLIQYFLTFVLLGFAINRVIKIFHN